MSKLEVLESRIAPATLFAVTSENHLIRFESTSPAVLDADIQITGLGAGEIVHGLDVRPATGELYLLTTSDEGATNSGRIYTIDPVTAVATQVGTQPFSTTLADSARYGFDFNPAVDRLRIVNTADENLRVHPETGALVSFDTALDDPMTGNDTITAVAYSRNFAGTAETTLYGIDFTGDKLVVIGGIGGNPSPNGGEVSTIGSLGGSFFSQNGFDIGADGVAYAALPSGLVTSLYTIALDSGAATRIDSIGSGSLTLRGLTAAQPMATVAADGKSATFIDVDGDLVTVRTSKGQFNTNDFVLFSAGGFGRAQLAKLALADDAGEFAGANLTITAKKSPTGNGVVDVGWIDSTGHDLGNVTVSGDLGRIYAGDADKTKAAVGKLKVGSWGANGALSQGGAFEAELSVINGSAGAITIGRDFQANAAFFGATGAVKIGGDLSGSFTVFGKAQSLTVGGSIDGRSGQGNFSASRIDFLKVSQSIIGGAAPLSGYVSVSNDIGKVFVGGDLIGDSGGGSGTIHASKKLGPVFIGGDIHGGKGGNGDQFANRRISGGITASEIASVTVGGSITNVTTFDAFSGFIGAATKLGPVTVKGSIQGTPDTPVYIAAAGLGTLLPAGAKQDVAIARLTVGGSVESANILAGFIADTGTGLGDSFFGILAANSNASIGAVKVGRDWVASNLVAGAYNADSIENVKFGNDNDQVIAIPAADNLVARIASIAIKGRVFGTAASGDHFGFVAQQIGKFSALGMAPRLTAGTDAPIALSALTGDVRIHEV